MFRTKQNRKASLKFVDILLKVFLFDIILITIKTGEKAFKNLIDAFELCERR